MQSWTKSVQNLCQCSRLVVWCTNSLTTYVLRFFLVLFICLFYSAHILLVLYMRLYIYMKIFIWLMHKQEISNCSILTRNWKSRIHNPLCLLSVKEGQRTRRHWLCPGGMVKEKVRSNCRALRNAPRCLRTQKQHGSNLLNNDWRRVPSKLPTAGS